MVPPLVYHNFTEFRIKYDYKNNIFPKNWKKCLRTVPTRGKMKPAPMLALTSLIGSIKPVGAPFLLGSDVRERWVFAMQIGKSLKPWK